MSVTHGRYTSQGGRVEDERSRGGNHIQKGHPQRLDTMDSLTLDPRAGPTLSTACARPGINRSDAPRPIYLQTLGVNRVGAMCPSLFFDRDMFPSLRRGPAGQRSESQATSSEATYHDMARADSMLIGKDRDSAIGALWGRNLSSLPAMTTHADKTSR